MTEGPRTAPVLLAVAALCAVLFLTGLGRLALLEKDEPRYAGTAREMVRSGDWLVPRFNGAERLVKPPLAYWAMGAAMKAAGRTDEVPARLPSAAAGTLLALLAALGAARACGPRWGGLAGAALATSLLFAVEARLATTDMLFTLFFTAAAACWIPVLEGSPRAGRWILLSGAAAGLAGLVKTPVAILLPPAAAVLAALLLGRAGGREAVPPAFRAGSRGRTALLLLGSVAVFAAVFLLWAAAAERATDGRLSAAFRDQLSARFDAGRDHHVEPPWYYLLLLVPAGLPWSLLLPAGCAAAAAEARRGGRGAVLLAYAAALAAVVVLFFSALPSKLPSYLLPTTVPMALLAAAGLREAAGDPEGRAGRLARRLGGGAALLLAAALAAAPLLPAVRERAGEGALREAAPALSLFAGLLGLGGILLLAGRIRGAAGALALSVLSLVFTLPPLFPRFERERSARDLAGAIVRGGLAPGDRLFDLTNDLTGVPFYADHATERSPADPAEGARPQDLLAALSRGERVFAVLDHDPADGRARGPGRRTQWERILSRWPEGAAPPRVLYTGMGRVAVASLPEGPR